MLAGNEAAGVRQGPIKVLVTPDVDAAFALNRHAQRAAVRQARLVLDCKRQAHPRLLCSRLAFGVDPSNRTVCQRRGSAPAAPEYGLGQRSLPFKPRRGRAMRPPLTPFRPCRKINASIVATRPSYL